MILIVSFLILLFFCFVFFTSKKYVRYYLISPVLSMSAYFIMIMLPGIYFASTDGVVLKALFAHLIWVVGCLSGLISAVILHRKNAPRANGQAKLHYNVTVSWLFVILAVPTVIFTFFMFGRIPLLIGMEGLFGGGNDLTMHAARRMNTLEHRNGDTVYFGQGYLRQIYMVVSPVFLVALFIYYDISNKYFKPAAAYFMMAFIVVASALNGQIWATIQVLFLFIMAKYYILSKSNRFMKDSSLLLRGLFTYLFLIGFIFLYRYLQSIQGREFDDFVFDTLRRLYSAGGVELFGLFPEPYGFRYGSTWLNDLRGLLPGSIQSFAYEVHYLVVGSAWGFTLSPGIVASTYVNFGFFGIYLAAFSFSLLFTLLFEQLIASDHPLKIALAIFISQQSMLAIPADFTTYILCLITAAAMYLSYGLLISFTGRGHRENFHDAPVRS